MAEWMEPSDSTVGDQGPDIHDYHNNMEIFNNDMCQILA